ncbi:MAG TPA: FHA domain-containing protein [Pirellulaceae bacterium]|nr:FHA domain-containing protein [Pirellulaceae bacterium]
MFGELIPVGGGDQIPLMKRTLLIGRRESCDIVLRFANVSAHHCTLSLDSGYWFIEDMNSRNGTKVNGVRVQAKKRLDPGDSLAVAKHQYRIQYSPADLGAVGPPPPDEAVDHQSIFGMSLLERAGIIRRKTPEKSTRYDPTNQSAGQIRDPNKPV